MSLVDYLNDRMKGAEKVEDTAMDKKEVTDGCSEHSANCTTIGPSSNPGMGGDKTKEDKEPTRGSGPIISSISNDDDGDEFERFKRLLDRALKRIESDLNVSILKVKLVSKFGILGATRKPDTPKE